MLINLSEIPAEGRTYNCTEKTGEFNAALADLVQNCPFSVDFQILPIGNIFEVRGSVQSNIHFECTRCLQDFALKFNQSIHELLIPGKELPRTGRESKVNHSSELETSGPSSSIVNYPNFDASSLMRDIVALGQPEHPVCSDVCKGLCQFCGTNMNLELCACDAVHKEEIEAPSPFSKLRDMKFN